jgi:hypothetical protein
MVFMPAVYGACQPVFYTQSFFSREQAESGCDFDGNVVSVCRQTIKLFFFFVGMIKFA